MMLISDAALRFLQIVTPEKRPITIDQAEHAIVLELRHAGLVITEGWGRDMSIRLTPQGREWRPSVNN